jgi:hypothetical protein
MQEKQKHLSMNRESVIALAAALAVCFILLAYFEPRFLLIHLYEAQIYIAIVLIASIFEDCWIYVFGILAPAGWLVLSVFTSGFGSIVRQVQRLVHLREPDYFAIVLGVVISCLSVAMIAASARGWKREFGKSGKRARTFLIGVAFVLPYDAGLFYWFWRLAAGQ